MDYIIVQAGGKGSRLEYLTKNKPKALIPIENLPMIFHTFNQFPDKHFIIIADYKKEVLHEYLHCFAKVKYQIVDANGTGTCSGIKQALNLIPPNEAFMLIWSDLILPQNFNLPDEYRTKKPKEDYVGISTTFPCRWSYVKGKFKEERSTDHGVAGFFLFTEKTKLSNIPESGELVRWMQQNGMKYKELSLAGTKEFGLLEEYNRLEKEKCRPFNKITVNEDKVIKEGIDEQGKKLAIRECRWYDVAREKNISIIPKIYSTNPLVMERIKGKNIYEYNLPYEQKKEILALLVDALQQLHKTESVPMDSFSLKEAYFNKTIDRINHVRDLIPFANVPTICINGKNCRNIFFYKKELEKMLEQIPCKEFCFIHGDCTFSNMMLRENGTPVLIDPRGYFGYTELYGDAMYDWAKLYYSVVGNYDRFNLKDFSLDITDSNVNLKIESNHWEELEEDFFEMTGADKKTIKLLHAIIWLSLSTYAWQDYDSICGAFYNGLNYLEEVM